MGWWSDLWGEDKDPEIKEISTLSPEQEQMMTQLSGFTKDRIGKGIPGWGGEFSAGKTPEEETALGILNQYLGSEMGETSKLGLEKYREGITGLDPDVMTDWYNRYRAPERQRVFEEQIEPTIREKYIGGGNLFGTDRMKETSRSALDWAEQGQGELMDTIMSERERATGMLRDLPAMTNIEEGFPVRKVEAGMTYGALDRQLKQEDINRRMEDFYRTIPEANPILDLASNLLGVQTKAAYSTPGETSFLTSLVRGGISNIFNKLVDPVGEAAGTVGKIFGGSGGGGASSYSSGGGGSSWNNLFSQSGLSGNKVSM